MLVYILLILGFIFLVKGADVLVAGASSIAKRFNISDMVVGLTIISFGTSLPELIINILSSAQGQSELAIGNVFGSNVANLLLIIGITAIICPLPIKRNTVLTEIPFSLIATLLVGFLANAVLLGDKTQLYISRLDGAILLFFFVMFMAYIYNIARTNDDPPVDEEADVKIMSIPKSVLFIVLGAAGLFVGGKWVVDSAVSIAQSYGLSESFIGLTVVAIGTSLPELVTSAIAAYRKNIDIAVGNVVGSNIFNLLWILGISAVITPLPFNVVSNSDIIMMIFASTLLIIVLPLGKQKNTIDRWNGILFLLIYIGYIVFLIQRG